MRRPFASKPAFRPVFEPLEPRLLLSIGTDLALWQQNYNPLGIFEMLQSGQTTSVAVTNEVIPPANPMPVESSTPVATAATDGSIGVVAVASQEDESLTMAPVKAEPIVLSQLGGPAVDVISIPSPGYITGEPAATTPPVTVYESLPATGCTRQLAALSTWKLDREKDLVVQSMGSPLSSTTAETLSFHVSAMRPTASVQRPLWHEYATHGHRVSTVSLEATDDVVDLLAAAELNVPLGK